MTNAMASGIVSLVLGVVCTLVVFRVVLAALFTSSACYLCRSGLIEFEATAEGPAGTVALGVTFGVPRFSWIATSVIGPDPRGGRSGFMVLECAPLWSIVSTLHTGPGNG